MVLVKPLECPTVEVVTTVVVVGETVPKPDKVAGTEEPMVGNCPVEVSEVPVAATEEVLFRGREPELAEEPKTSQSRTEWG